MKNLPNVAKYGLNRIKTYATVWFISYLAISFFYTTASLVGWVKGVQVVVRETQYVQEVKAISPIGE